MGGEHRRGDALRLGRYPVGVDLLDELDPRMVGEDLLESAQPALRGRVAEQAEDGADLALAVHPLHEGLGHLLPIATSSADMCETQYLKSQGCRLAALFQLVTK